MYQYVLSNVYVFVCVERSPITTHFVVCAGHFCHTESSAHAPLQGCCSSLIPKGGLMPLLGSYQIYSVQHCLNKLEVHRIYFESCCPKFPRTYSNYWNNALASNGDLRSKRRTEPTSWGSLSSISRGVVKQQVVSSASAQPRSQI